MNRGRPPAQILDAWQERRFLALPLPGKAKPAGSRPADPKDEMFLACPLEGQADLILSGDHHLLELGSWQNIPIITARQFVERLGQPHPFIHQ